MEEEKTLISLSPPTVVTTTTTTLPFELLEKILSMLSVKFLSQLRCVCKSFNSLISNDPIFARNHLRASPTRHHLIVSGSIDVSSYPLFQPDFTTVDSTALTNNQYSHRIVGSCDGLLCVAISEARSHELCIVLWNPSIRKYNKLPSLIKPHCDDMYYGFGCDLLKDKYKVVVVFWDSRSATVSGKVHTLGTDSWKSIQEFPSNYAPFNSLEPGMYVSGTINWMSNTTKSCFILSLDLGKETYKQIALPDQGITFTLGVLRDCLCTCIGYHSNDVWLMKEYGNKESWTKLFSIPHLAPWGFKPLYIYDEDHIMLVHMGEFFSGLAVFNSKDYSLRVLDVPHIYRQIVPIFYVESLMSPF